MKETVKKIIPYIVAIALFAGLSVAYFAPVVFENKTLFQGDVTSAGGWGKDLADYHQETGEYAYWSNAMFGGMPANYTYGPPMFNIFSYFGNVYLLGLPIFHVGLVFIYLLGFYIFMLSLGCKPWLSLAGAVAYAFASYNLIIIEAGHVNKGLVMATMAPVIGGIILCYRQKYLWGTIITLIFTGLNVVWGHQQISYYLLLTIFILAIVYLIDAIKEHTLKDYLKSSVVLIIIALLAIAPESGKMLATIDYTEETMRGGAVLQNTPEGKKESSGLEIDYAYQWSYGKGETLTLLIPNLYGASSNYNIGKDSETYKALRHTGQAAQFTKHAPMYWGGDTYKTFTSGPVYGGAIICFLFVMGLLIVKGKEKWWLLGATLMSVCLSWGRHFPLLNDFLFYHLPLYNKFRTPEMALVIANLTMATLAILAIKEIIEKNKDNPKEYRRAMYISGGITAGLCLIFALFGGSLFNFSAMTDQNFPDWLVSALVADRKAMLSGDAWRSFFFIALAFSVLYWYLKKPFKVNYLILSLGVLMFIDVWLVDKRFINNDSFTPKKKGGEIIATPADLQILQDKDPNYRVLNLSKNTFNESETSYFHKSIGGYSPAKLRRYQDIIDYHLSGSVNPSVLNMLNTRYVVVPTEQGPQVQTNLGALGNAWFVDSLQWVNSPDEEIVALTDFNPAKKAIIDNEWNKLSDGKNLQGTDSTAAIRLIDYVNPGYLIYESSNLKDRLAVFSEVYYKTWHAYIDGKEASLLRVNYILRGLEIPAGNHKIELKCIDEVYLQGKKMSMIASVIVGIILLGLLGIAVWTTFIRPKRQRN